MTITSQTTTQRRWRTTLAGGITVSLDPAVFGATLTLSDTLRALTLTLTPEQVDEMATWEACTPAYHHAIYDPQPCAANEYVWIDLSDFIYSRLRRPPLDVPHEIASSHGATDIATLRDLARAYQEAQP